MSAEPRSLTIAYLAQGRIRIKTQNEPPRTIDSVFGNSIREKAVRAQQKNSWKSAGNDGSPFSAVLWGKSAKAGDIPLVITSICGAREPHGLVYSLESGTLCALLEVSQLGVEERRLWNDNRTPLRHVSVSRSTGNMVFSVLHENGTANIGVKIHGEGGIKELTEGVGDTGIKAGVIKLATAMPPFTDYEKTIFRAGAAAALATGAPITTHTDAVMGDEQLSFLTSLGVPAHKIVIGHSCGNPDHDYHMKIVDGGAYIGFDRFGLEIIQPDQVRVESLVKLLKKGRGRQVMISHDSVWCWKGHMLPPVVLQMIEGGGGSMRFTRVITPMLKEAGVSDGEIEGMLTENPRRYFEGM